MEDDELVPKNSINEAQVIKTLPNKYNGLEKVISVSKNISFSSNSKKNIFFNREVKLVLIELV